MLCRVGGRLAAVALLVAAWLAPSTSFAQDGLSASLAAATGAADVGAAACAAPARAQEAIAFARDLGVAPVETLRAALAVCPEAAGDILLGAVRAAPDAAAALYRATLDAMPGDRDLDASGVVAGGLGGAGGGALSDFLRLVAEYEGADAARRAAEIAGVDPAVVLQAVAMADNSDGPTLRGDSMIEQRDALPLVSSTGRTRGEGRLSITLPDTGERPSPN